MIQAAFPMPAQRRRPTPEGPVFYGAVIYLRLRGHRVYRCGRAESLVNGARVSNGMLVRLTELVTTTKRGARRAVRKG